MRGTVGQTFRLTAVVLATLAAPGLVRCSITVVGIALPITLTDDTVLTQENPPGTVFAFALAALLEPSHCTAPPAR